MRVRGLKHVFYLRAVISSLVAPHAGAWIETAKVLYHVLDHVASHPMRVRGLKQTISLKANY